jgi:hypothetical protein
MCVNLDQQEQQHNSSLSPQVPSPDLLQDQPSKKDTFHARWNREQLKKDKKKKEKELKHQQWPQPLFENGAPVCSAPGLQV